METKPLLFGLIGFFLGGLIVSVAATTFDQPNAGIESEVTMQMSDSLKGKQGDEFDKAFIAEIAETKRQQAEWDYVYTSIIIGPINNVADN